MAKQNATIVKCTGEAHSNPFIDNCGVCMPWWRQVPNCPTDGTKLLPKGYGTGNIDLNDGFCRTCKRHFEVIR